MAGAPTTSTAGISLLRLRRSPALRSQSSHDEAAAFAELYRRHHQALYRYCLSILRHEQDAQDVLQNTMVKAHHALATEQRDFELRPWLFRVAHNECISLVRRRRETSELADQLPAPTTTEGRHAERAQLRQLQADLSELTERQRSALVLRELSGLSHEEIATVLGVSASAAKSTIFEARSALLLFREGRDMACSTVRQALSDGDRRVLHGRAHRAHLRDCAGCRAFRSALTERPGQLAALAPPLPAALAVAVLHHVLPGAAGHAASAGVAAGAGASAGGGTVWAGSSVLGGLGAKVAAGAAVAALAAGGAATIRAGHDAGAPQGPPGAGHAITASPPTAVPATSRSYLTPGSGLTAAPGLAPATGAPLVVPGPAPRSPRAGRPATPGARAPVARGPERSAVPRRPAPARPVLGRRGGPSRVPLPSGPPPSPLRTPQATAVPARPTAPVPSGPAAATTVAPVTSRPTGAATAPVPVPATRVTVDGHRTAAPAAVAP